LATVRIYKVAELLALPSQDVLALLKKEHGIELKSASSTIEEVVARSLIERAVRDRGLTPPTGDWFSGTAAKGGKAAKKTAPLKVAKPRLGPPRLVKSPKPAPKPDEADETPADGADPVADEALTPEGSAVEASAATAPEQLPPPVTETEAPSATESPAKPAPDMPPATGRVVPPTLRLRIEEGGKTPPARPLTPAKRPPPPRPPPVARPTPPARPPGSRPRQPPPLRPTTPSLLGGPRPLPAQPIRPAQPYGRPGMPGRPPMGRPPMGRAPSRRPTTPRSQRRARPQAPTLQQTPVAPPPITRSITLAEGMTVKDLADKLEVRVKDVLARLLMKRVMLTINSTIDVETAKELARDFGADIEMRSFEEELVSAEGEESDPGDRVMRAPVVTVMGHVDHGKTSLLDAIRETRVAEREAGGITQHIGAYHVDVGSGRSVVFLDTPGHAAFTLMRARGAKVTDVVVLVVAADDGVMPQTKEAIDHSKAASVPIVVAINKVDKAGVNLDNVKRELAEASLVPEDWGGNTVMVPVSAKKRENLGQLLEMILLTSDILELKADPNRSASGTVLEAKLDRGRGPVATILVQDGTLRVGDNFIAGPVVGKVRALIDDRGKPTKAAGPSVPVEVLGLTSLPKPGDLFQAVADAAKARQIATFRQTQAKDRALSAGTGRLTMQSLQQQIAEGGIKELPLVVKADVQGSAEVLADTLTKLSNDKVRVRIIGSGVGAINESDVLLASASNAIVIGFNVRPDRNAAEISTQEKVDVRLHSVIYKLTEEIELGMAGLLDPTFKEVRVGAAEVREVFKVPKIGAIGGCMVTEGRVARGGDHQVRVLRDDVVIHEGKIGSLRRFKDDVNEVKSGYECGIGIDRFNDLKTGDVIEVFAMETVAPVKT
jgi:translation initiation factor IF-2